MELGPEIAYYLGQFKLFFLYFRAFFVDTVSLVIIFAVKIFETSGTRKQNKIKENHSLKFTFLISINLGLDNCPLVTDGALEHLISCHNLQLIELYDCQMVTRNAIRKLRVSPYYLVFFQSIFFIFFLVFLYFNNSFIKYYVLMYSTF